MVCVDIYRNETTRHADVILPAPIGARRSRTTTSRLLQLAVRNVANYSPPVFDREPDQPDEWEILAGSRWSSPGQGADADPSIVDDLAIGGLVQNGGRRRERAGRSAATPTRSWRCWRPARGPERLLDFMLRTGPYGDGFGRAERLVHAVELPRASSR